MEILIFIIILILIIIGLIGSFMPVIPGPPISYIALLLYHFYLQPIETDFLWLMAVIIFVVTFLDFWVQIYGVKKFGGNKKAVNGSIIGLILGIIFLPGLGILIGPFFGAFIGAKIENPNTAKAFKIALGALTGFVIGTLLKLIVSGWISCEILFRFLDL